MATPQLTTYFQTFTPEYPGLITICILNVEAYHTVNVQIIQSPPITEPVTVLFSMGKLSEPPLATSVGQFQLGTAMQIHSFPVIGPEFGMTLEGPTNTAVPIQAWVFLH